MYPSVPGGRGGRRAAELLPESQYKGAGNRRTGRMPNL